jgi:hypothetical protein
MSGVSEVEIDSLPPYALRCPHGHSSWEPIDGHFTCRACSRSERDTDGTFQEVHNVQTGETLDREELAQLEEHACRNAAD